MRQHVPAWQTILVYGVAVALIALGAWMRLHDLGLSFDRDGYDEGVYWQSLQAMSTGHVLYQQIFYSQPPFFLLSLFPFYTLFGQTLWAARLGVAVISLFGLVGAFAIGRALSGRIGALAALLLLVVDPSYLAQSQTLQAEASCVAFSFLAVGLAYLWWETPTGPGGSCLAILSGITLALGILAKLFGVAALVPTGLVAIAYLWRITRKPARLSFSAILPLLLALSAFIVTTFALLLPFFGSWSQLIKDVVSFHIAAGNLSQSGQSNKLSTIQTVMISVTSAAALYGTVVALLRRDWRVLPLLAWLLATLAILFEQTPLFYHHLVVLIPPLISLAVMGIGPVPFTFSKQDIARSFNILAIVTVLVVLFVAAWDGVQDVHYYSTKLAQSNDISVTKWDVNVEHDLQAITQPGQLVITDAQFLTAIAKRGTPAFLVDTSAVRIDTGYLTPQQLIQEASQPQVHAVLFYSQRLLRMKNITIFYSWLVRHFHLYRHYYPGKELWIRL